MDIDISGVNKAKLLAALYNNTRPLGLGVFVANTKVMDEVGGQVMIAAHRVEGDDTVWFDYVQGRPIKVGFREDVLLRADLYDRDAPDGEGSAQRIVDSLRTPTESSSL